MQRRIPVKIYQQKYPLQKYPVTEISYYKNISRPSVHVMIFNEIHQKNALPGINATPGETGLNLLWSLFLGRTTDLNKGCSANSDGFWKQLKNYAREDFFLLGLTLT